MIAWLATQAAGLLGQTFINTIGKMFLDGYKMKLDATNSHEGKVVELASREADLQQREAEVQGQIIVAEQGRWWTAAIRPLMVVPVGIYIWKVIVWDKVLGLGTTDSINDPLVASVVTVMVGAYFGGRSIEKIASWIKNKK